MREDETLVGVADIQEEDPEANPVEGGGEGEEIETGVSTDTDAASIETDPGAGSETGSDTDSETGSDTDSETGSDTDSGAGSSND